MASVFLYHVVGDLTVAKPELVEFVETETVESAIRAIGDSTESGIPVWRWRSIKAIGVENAEIRQQRFLGILNTLDIVGFLAGESCLQDHEKALKTPVSEIVVPNNSLLREVDPATRDLVWAVLDILGGLGSWISSITAGKDSFPSNGVSSTKSKTFSSRGIGFMGSSLGPNRGSHRTVYRGRSAPLTCKATSSLAAVMAQMLSHRATHVWVTGQDDDDVLVGVVGYADILHAVTRQPLSISFPT
ncbi:CBS domain-containing protein [Drosera capensis]